MKVTSKVKHLPVAFLRPMTAWVVHQTGYWTTREVGNVFYAPHKETAERWRTIITNHGGVSLRIQIDIGPLAEGQNPLSPEYLFPIVGALALSLRHARGRSPHGQMLGQYRTPEGKTFLEQAPTLIQQWRAKADAAPKPPTKLERDLKTAHTRVQGWKRKLKLAQTKLKLWSREVLRLERRIVGRERHGE